MLQLIGVLYIIILQMDMLRIWGWVSCLLMLILLARIIDLNLNNNHNHQGSFLIIVVGLFNNQIIGKSNLLLLLIIVMLIDLLLSIIIISHSSTIGDQWVLLNHHNQLLKLSSSLETILYSMSDYYYNYFIFYIFITIFILWEHCVLQEIERKLRKLKRVLKYRFCLKKVNLELNSKLCLEIYMKVNVILWLFHQKRF